MTVKFIKLQNPLENPSSEQEEKIKQAFKAVVLQMRNEAVNNCPVDTGALKSDVASHQFEVNENTFEIGSSMEYASYVHDGTHKIPARPFIDHAIDQLEDQLSVVISKALGGV